MDVVYVVVGMTGEYSDQRQWPICAYHDEQLAKDHVVAATEWAAAEHARVGRYGGHMASPSPYDPEIEIDYTGTQYRYDAVTVRDTLLKEAPAKEG